MYTLTFAGKLALAKENTQSDSLDSGIVVQNPYAPVAILCLPVMIGGGGVFDGEIAFYECEYVGGRAINRRYLYSKPMGMIEARNEAVNRVNAQLLWINLDVVTGGGVNPPSVASVASVAVEDMVWDSEGDAGFYDQVNAQNELLHPIESDNNAPRVWTWFSQVLKTEYQWRGFANILYSGGDWKVVTVEYYIENGEIVTTKNDYMFSSLERVEEFLNEDGYNGE